MATAPKRKPERDPDERVKLPLDPEDALRALLAVDPDEGADAEGQSGNRKRKS